MYCANGNEDHRRQFQKLIDDDRDGHQERHPVEVVVKREEDNDFKKETEDRCSFRSWYIGIISFVIGGTAAFGLIYYFLMIPDVEKPLKPENLNSPPEESSSPSNVIFNDWYATLKQGKIEQFDFDSAINKELANYYDEIIEQNQLKFLKKFFNHNHRHLQTIYTENDFLEFLSRFDSNKLNFFIKTLREMKNPPISLLNFKSFFDRTEDLHFWYNYLYDLRIFLSSYSTQKNRSAYSQTITNQKFSSFTNQTQIEMLNDVRIFVSDDKKLKELNELVCEFTENVQISRTDTSITFENKIIILSEVEKKLQNSSFLDVSVFATDTLFLDVDLNLPGTNLALISPHWEFLRNITINLDGPNGAAHKMPNANEGENGKPGNPGRNGGDFIALGEFDELKLTVYSKGGNGSNGQNGADGRDGIDGGRPNLKDKNPTCVAKDHITVNKMKEVVVFYNVYDSKGCGGSGTDGGHGGYGGKGGEIFLINTSSKKSIVKKNENGKCGEPGKGGKGGIGGRNGCFYKAYRINNRSWNPLSVIFCGNKSMPSGEPGKDNGNDVGLLEPTKKKGVSTFAVAVSEYRRFAREKATKYKDVEIYSVLKKMDETPAVCNLTEPEALLIEMQEIEKSKNVEFYESLIRRIDLVLKCSNNEDHKKMLKQFRLLVLGKKSNLKYAFGNYLVINLEKYLDSITDRLSEVNNTGDVKKLEENQVLKESFEKKLKELEVMLKEKKIKLNNVYLYHNNTVQDLLKNNFLMERENIKNVKYYEALAEHLDAKKITYLLMTTCRVLQPLVRITKNHLLHQKADDDSYLTMNETITEYENLKIKNLKLALSISNVTVENLESAFDEGSITPHQREILLLSQILVDFKDYDKQKILEKSTKFSKVTTKKFRDNENDLLEHIKILSDQSLDLSGIRNHVQKLKKVVDEIVNEYGVNDNGKYILNGVISEMEHYITVLAFLESYSQEIRFIKMLNNSESFMIKNADLYEKTMDLKKRLCNVFIASQYKHALNAFRQWVFPHVHMYEDLSKPSEEMPMAEAMANIQTMKRKVKEYKSTITSWDKNIIEAAFQTNSSIGEFYLWDNREISSELTDLLSGKEITLKADVENIHILNKNAIKFKTIGLEFRMRNTQENDVAEYLKNFAISLTHSGYSYYYYKGETYIITSDDVAIYYSWKTENGVPEACNEVYKKLQNGDIMLSPYTTWKIQLQQINAEANYEKLFKYAGKVDLALIGSGTYIAETYDTNIRLDESYRPLQRDQ